MKVIILHVIEADEYAHCCAPTSAIAEENRKQSPATI